MSEVVFPCIGFKLFCKYCGPCTAKIMLYSECLVFADTGKDLSLAQVRTDYSRTVIPMVGRLYGELCLDVHFASINPLTNQTFVVFF